MTHRQRLLAITAAGLLAPALALAQGSSGSSMMPQTTQTTPQQGPLDGTPGARAGGNAGQATTQTTPGNNAGSPQGGAAPGRQTPPQMQSQGMPANPGQANPGNEGRPADRGLGGSTAGPASTAATGTNAARGAGAASGTLAVDSAVLRGGRRASKVIGASVYNENNETIGEVDDILIPLGGGSPVAVISVGGFLGIGAKLVAVPYERLQAAGSGNRWTLTGATKDSLGSLPTFTYDAATEKKS